MVTTETTTILKRVRDIAHDVAAPNAEKIDQQALWPKEALQALQAAGLGGLVVPQSYGGLGHGLLTLVQVCEVLGQACSSTALCFGMHCVGSAVIAAKSTAYQQQHYLQPIAEGKHLTTLALSEPGSGSHFYLPQTQLSTTSEDRLEINGVKTFVTNGEQADSYVISTVAADPHAPLGDFSCVILPSTTKGLTWGSSWSGLGMRGNAARTLTIEQAHVTSELLLGETGDEIWYVFAVIAPYFLMAMAGTYLGIAQAALDTCRAHLVKRRYSHSGMNLAQNTVVQYTFGELWANVERTRQLIYAAAQKEGDAMPYLAAAKADVAECVVHVVNESMTLMGGTAYRDDAIMSRLLRDARAAHVMSPTTDMLRLWTGRSLLGVPLLVD